MGKTQSKDKYEEANFSKRKMSFTSASMAFGAWPEKVNMCEPTINATLYFDTCPTVEGLVPLCQVVSSYERCAGIPEGTPGKADWRIKFVDFEPKDMIRTIKASSDDEVHTKIENLLHDSTRNRNLPWWEIVRIEAPKGCRSAIVIRIDHVIGDGISLVNLMEQILTDNDGAKLDEIIPASMSKKFNRKLSFGQKFCQFFKIIYYFFVVLGLPVGSFDTKTAFRANMGAKMDYTWKRKLIRFQALPLDYVKKLKSEGGVSLNDVMFTCLGGAIRRYNIAQNCEVTDKKKKNIRCRALMPVAFPRPNVDKNDKSAILRNKWVFVGADFGVGYEDVVERLRYVNGNMNVMKNSPLAGVQLAVQESIPPKLPLNAGRKTVHDTFVRHSVIFSNVPGPEKIVKFGGQEVMETQMYFNNLLPQVGILSYRGNIFMNMNMDTEAIPGGEMMPVYFAREMLDLSENDASVLCKGDVGFK
eukprot:CAMPEP_0118667660 /NCGR_PEP_ID=MMETSP0785-20121206/19912_1 /TAXON_ID=91992 /ORGANISM="Bolidomonas pacifica, Strain CCMP 1866" /LENGTH=471 /DNA_ID=CAMNT_0006562143 /DNA_START=14 /DNA_END=1430 /DNA_ORIENTATION=-